MKIIKSLLVGLLSLSFILTASAADTTLDSISNYSPERPGLTYVEGEAGLPYPSFNNFINNPNIIQGARKGDERKFLIGKICPDPDDCGNEVFLNTVGNVKEGDTVRLEIYYHNNGGDPYDDGGDTSPDATNVSIGVNLNNIVDPNDSLILRPEGFIYADNNQYRTNTAFSSTVITDSSGVVVKTALDDMEVYLSEAGLELKPVPGSAWIGTKINENTGEEFSQNILAKTAITYLTQNPSSITANVTPFFSSNAMWVTFDKLPGCFRYSGFVQFDAIVVKKPIAPYCTELSGLYNSEITPAKAEELTGQAGIKDMQKLSVGTLQYSNGNVPADATVEINASSNITLWKAPTPGAQLQEIGKSFTGLATDFNAGKIDIYFTGDGNITAKGLPDAVDGSFCNAFLPIAPQPPEPECTELTGKPIQVVPKETVIELSGQNPDQKVYKLSINSIKFDNGAIPANAEIEWKSEDVYGVFWTTDTNGVLSPIGGNKQITAADPTAEIFYTGNGPITAKIIPSIYNPDNICEISYAVPLEPVCTEIEVNHFSTIFDQRLSYFEAKATGSDGGPFNGKITYTVEPGYGMFYTVNNPDNSFVANEAEYITEFNASIQIPKPDGGLFCSGLQEPRIATGTIIRGGNSRQTLDLIQTVISGDINKIQGSIKDIQGASAPQQILNMQASTPRAADFGKATIFEFNPGSVTDPTTGTTLAPLGQPTITAGETIEELIESPSILLAESLLAGETITVNPGQRVWFHADKPGENVISVQTNCTDSYNCIRYFDIEPLPTTTLCETSDLIVQKYPAAQVAVQCLNKGIYNFQSNFYEDAAKTKLIPADQVSVKWTTTDPTGEFYDPVDFITSLAAGKTPTPLAEPQEPNIGGFRVFYAGGGQVTSSLFELDGVFYKGGICSAKIDPCENECAELTLESTPGDPLDIGQEAKLSVGGGDLNGAQLPSSTTLLFKTDTGANFNGTTSGELLLTLGQVNTNPVNFTNSQNIGTASVEISSTDPLYSADCKDQIIVTQPMLCTEINVTITDSTGAAATELDPNEIYSVVGSATYTVNNPLGKMTYTLDPAYGRFVDHSTTPVIKSIVSSGLSFLKLNGNISMATLQNLSAELEAITGSSILSSEVTVADNEKVNFVIFSNQTTSNASIFRARATGYFNTECDIDYPFTFTSEEETPVCEDLRIILPNRPWTYDAKDDNQVFAVELEANDPDAFYYAWEVLSGEGEWKNGKDFYVTGPNEDSAKLNNTNDETTVEVWASESSNGSKILDTDGNPICIDRIKVRIDEEPEFEKLVYVRGNENDGDNLLNIGDNTGTKYDYLTYQIGFNSGSQTGSVDIEEERFDNGSIQGDKDGELKFESMRINVIEFTDSNKTKEKTQYTVLKTKNYEDEDNDDDYNEYGNGEDLDEYEADFNCDDGSKSGLICINDNGDGFDSVVEDFKEGRSIQFENVGPYTSIFIKVQVKNDSEIDDAFCKTLEESDGCGEEFINRSSFLMSTENTNEEFDGRDDAKVIVICPYILTRSAGDVFFNDVLDTGSDVAQCSKVKSTPGVIVTPEDEDITITSTGEGTLSDATEILSLPSHDICRYSNIADNIEGYADELKNFSSTVCELKAEIADAWTEKNINAAINANITRLARFGSNLLKGKKITSMPSLNEINNAESGVFISDGEDLIIDLNGNPLQGTDKVPAAQTYIVKGANLIIESNIVYGETTYTDLNNIPSAAFIVIDGNIIIKDNVTQIDGILMAVDLDNVGNDGRVTNKVESTDSETISSEPLTINGNLIGNVFELFSTRRGVGDPTKDEGSVTIRYDERILLNTPPGLSELINVSQAIIPN